MGRSAALGLGLAAVGTFAACVDPDSGVGYGSTAATDSPSTSSDGLTSMAEDGGTDDPGFVPPLVHSYFIAESTDFTGNGCENHDVNVVTRTLRDALAQDGWVGIRVTEANTTPSDFIDPVKQPFGLDPEAGDSALLSVYAGHGYMDKLQWGTADTSPGLAKYRDCIAYFAQDMRLGALSGGWARVVLLLTSCSGRLACYKSMLGTSNATQTFAFNNSPSIWNNAARRFYRKSKHMANRLAWIKAMDDSPGLGANSPVVYTRATSRKEALRIHASARLSRLEEIPHIDRTTWFAYTWVDHGLRGTCIPLLEECRGVDD